MGIFCTGNTITLFWRKTENAFPVESASLYKNSALGATPGISLSLHGTPWKPLKELPTSSETSPAFSIHWQVRNCWCFISFISSNGDRVMSCYRTVLERFQHGRCLFSGAFSPYAHATVSQHWLEIFRAESSVFGFYLPCPFFPLFQCTDLWLLSFVFHLEALFICL